MQDSRNYISITFRKRKKKQIGVKQAFYLGKDAYDHTLEENREMWDTK